MIRKSFILAVMMISILIQGCNRSSSEVTDVNKITISEPTGSAPAVTVIPAVTTLPAKSLTSVPTPTVKPTSVIYATTTSKPTPTPSPVHLANSMTKEEYPVVDGSTATIPLSEAVYRLATGATEEEAASAIIHTKTSGSYYRLMNGEADLLIVYEPSEEVKEYMDTKGFHLQLKPIGKDALVFMANTSNPVETLTAEQLVQIYSGKITNWSEVGGEDKELLAFQRPEGSGSQTLMQKLVMKKVAMAEGPQVKTYAEMEGILKAMAEYTNEANTLGYSVFYYAKNMYSLPELRFMKVEGVEPSLQTIYDNSYPYVNELYAVIREDEPYDSNAHKIFDWLTQEEGQDLVKSTGYVPVSMEPIATEEVNEVNTDIIPEGYVYILESEWTSVEGINLSSITIYEGNWSVRRIFKNVSYIQASGLVSKTEPIQISMAIHDSAGEYQTRPVLYDIEADTFAISPEYDLLFTLNQEKGIYCVLTQEEFKVFNHSGRQLLTIPSEGESYISQEGDYYWFYNMAYSNDQYVLIYDKNLRFVKKVTSFDTYNTIYSDEGELILSKNIFLEQFGYQEATKEEFNIVVYSDSLIAVLFEGYYWFLDYDLKLIGKHEASLEGYSIYCDTIEDMYFISKQTATTLESTYYDNEGQLITDESGIPYDNYLSSYYTHDDNANSLEIILYRMDEDHVYLYRPSSGIKYSIELKDATNYYLGDIYKDFLIIKPRNNSDMITKVYLGTEFIIDLKDWYHTSWAQRSSGYLLMAYTDTGNSYVLFDDQGKITYRSPYPEQIRSIDDKYIQVTRGNYTGVIDFSGNYLIKNIWEGIAND